MNFAKFLGTPLITEDLQWLLLNTKKASQLNVVDTKGAQLNTLRNLAMFSLELQLLTMIIVSSLVFFQNVLKLLTSPLHLRRTDLQKKLTTDWLVYFQKYLKFMKDLCMIIWVIILMMFYQNFNAAFGEVLVPKTVYFICTKNSWQSRGARCCYDRLV